MEKRELLKLRDNELWEAYLEKTHSLGRVMQECKLGNVLKDINNMGCSRYWIDYERARVVLENMKHGINPYHQPQRRRMCEDMFIRYKELEEQYPSMLVSHLVERTITSHAKSFYLNYRTVSNIIFATK